MTLPITLYRIQKITRETHNTITWEIVPEEGTVPDYEPGQFAMIHLFNPDGTVWKKKAYSMSSSPREKRFLEFGIKIHGEFTQKMATLEAGETVGVQAPFGNFIYKPAIHTDLVIFAGGIGITPFMAMTRFAGEEAPENRITMFYCNQTERDIAYKKSLDDLSQKNPNIRIVYSVDRLSAETTAYEIGFINEERIKKYAPNFSGTYFFMCGPIPFMKSVREILHKNRVGDERIKQEVF